MKTSTKYEIAYFACILVIVACLATCVQIVSDEVEQKGLKNIVNEVWEGKQ